MAFGGVQNFRLYLGLSKIIFFLLHMKHFFILFLLFSFYGMSQDLKGIVYDETDQPLIGVLVETDNGLKTRTNMDGEFSVPVKDYPVTLTFKFFDFKTMTKTVLEPMGDDQMKVTMTPLTQNLEGVVVSASRRQQNIEDIPVSLVKFLYAVEVASLTELVVEF